MERLGVGQRVWVRIEQPEGWGQPWLLRGAVGDFGTDGCVWVDATTDPELSGWYPRADVWTVYS